MKLEIILKNMLIMLPYCKFKTKSKIQTYSNF